MQSQSSRRPISGRDDQAVHPQLSGCSVRPLVLSTRDVPKQQQFEAWRDLCVPYLDTGRPALPAEQGFEAKGTALRLGSMMYYHAVLPPYDHSRSQARIRRDSLDHWIIGICRRGTQRQRSGEFDLTMRTDIPYVLTMARPFDAQREGDQIEWASMFVARDSVPELDALFTAALYRPLEGPAGRLLAAFIETLQDVAHDLRANDLAHLEAATSALLAAALDANRDRIEAARPQIEHLQLARLKRLVRDNLGAATLGPARLCAMGGVSRSALYRLFEPLGGVARFIQRERLAAAHRLLTDPNDRRGIAQMAEAVGFFEPSSFSRAFRVAFGASPRELRAAALAGHGALPSPNFLGEEAGVANVSAILRRL